MSDLLDYRLDGAVAVLTLDDGKANVYSHAAIDAIHEGLDRAEGEARAVLLVGRPGKFSAGFDLSVMTSGLDPMRNLVRAGAELALRVAGFGLPTVAASTGHALAMGSILLLAFDRRIGADGPFKIGMNEVAIGMHVPHFAVELGRARMATPQFQELLFGRVYDPAGAVAAGFLDRVVPAEELLDVALDEASALSAINSGAHATTKRNIRGPMIELISANLGPDLATLGPPST